MGHWRHRSTGVTEEYRSTQVTGSTGAQGLLKATRVQQSLEVQ